MNNRPSRRDRRRQRIQLASYCVHSGHHRRPESLNGSKIFPVGNYVLIPHQRHVAWHKVACNFWPEVYLHFFNCHFVLNGEIFVPVNMFSGRLRGPVATDKNFPAWYHPDDFRLEAWDFLFKGKTMAQVAAEMNTCLADPHYRVEVRPRPVVVASSLVPA